MQKTDRILILTRGDYVTRLMLEPLLQQHPVECLRVVVIAADSNGRTGLNQLKAMLKEYDFGYFLFEFCQFVVFKLAELIVPNVSLSVNSLANRLGIEISTTTLVNSPAVLELAQQWQPDFLISAKCPQRIGEELLKLPKYPAINIHGSLLPKYAGRAPHFWAMVNNDKLLGCTVHTMTAEFDEGAILTQRSIEVPHKASVFSMIVTVSKLAGDALLEALIGVAIGAVGTPQNADQRSYFSSPSKAAVKQLRSHGYRLLRCRELLSSIVDSATRKTTR